MRITVIAAILLLYGCAVMTDIPSAEHTTQQYVEVSSVETARYKSNYRIKLILEGETGVRAEAKKEFVSVVFDHAVNISPEAQNQLGKMFFPCTYSKSYQKDPSKMTFRCPGGLKVYPEKGTDYFDLIITRD